MSILRVFTVALFGSQFRAGLGHNDPCPVGTLPFFQCDFNAQPGVWNACWKAINYGQAASYSGPCTPPSRNNPCKLESNSQYVYLWQPQNTCCNCMQKKLPKPENSYCPVGSLPSRDCDFQNTWRQNACWPSINTGQAADPDDYECQVPSPSNGCEYQTNYNTGVISWGSNRPGVRCCNCFAKRNGQGPGASAQVEGHTSSSLRKRVTGSEVSKSGGNNPCPEGTLPAFQCDYNAQPGTWNACWKAINYGQAASDAWGSPCTPPSMGNNCALKPNNQYVYLWQPQQQCCNCMQKKFRKQDSYCPAGSLPYEDCNFRSFSNRNSCWQSVNTGQAANPKRGECELPSPSNGCVYQTNFQTGVIAWESHWPGVRCCNCFALRNGPGSLTQVKGQEL